MADVRMTKNRWRALAESVRVKADDVTELYASAIVTTAAAQSPYKYGHLRDSIEQSSEGAALARRRIVVGQYYGIFLEKGTEAHEIKAKPGGVLAFGGRFATKVQHPGTDARPFLEPAVEQWRADYLQAIRLVVA